MKTKKLTKSEKEREEILDDINKLNYGKVLTPQPEIPLLTVRELIVKFENEPWEHLLYSVLAAMIKKSQLTEEEIRAELAVVKEIEAERVSGRFWHKV